ncbi:MAG: hypothetical protein JW870_19135 [Candidatus Delongbacteria bacterium]|nr:hypothetical protein [Candidatus Delongbacteria bacterium]
MNQILELLIGLALLIFISLIAIGLLRLIANLFIKNSDAKKIKNKKSSSIDKDKLDKLLEEYEDLCIMGEAEDEEIVEFVVQNKLIDYVNLEDFTDYIMTEHRWTKPPEFKFALSVLLHFPKKYHSKYLKILEKKLPEIYKLIKSDHSYEYYGRDYSDNLFYLALNFIKSQAQRREKIACVIFDIIDLYLENSDRFKIDDDLNFDDHIRLSNGVLERKFWKACLYHNIYMKDKENSTSKKKALKHMKEFIKDTKKYHNREWGSHIREFNEFIKKYY